MYRIAEKKNLTEDIIMLGVEAPHITKNARAGNFIVVINDEKGERVPLTIYDWNPQKGIVYMVFQTVGTSTYKLGQREVGESIFAIAGPLGRPFEVNKYGNVVIIGGGVGVPAIFPIARSLKEAGNKVTSIMGFRTKGLIILEEEMKSVSSELKLATNDGSKGVKGLVTDVLQSMIDAGEKIDLVIAIGPAIMMKVVSDLTRKYNLKTIVSLNAVMVDASGMCGGCRVTIKDKDEGKDKVYYSCVDGPDFDGHDVDFDELMSRQAAYKPEEAQSLNHCRLNGIINKAEKNG